MPTSFDNNGRAWSLIPETPQYLEKLQLLCHSQKEIKAEGYVIEPFNSRQIQNKSRCENCGARFKVSYSKKTEGKAHRGKGKAQRGNASSHQKNVSQSLLQRAPAQGQHEQMKSKPAEDLLIDRNEPSQELNEAFPTVSDLRGALVEVEAEASKSLQKQSPQPPVAPKPVCSFHPGGVAYKRFTCCNEAPSTPGCTEMLKHSFLDSNDPYLLSYWKFYATPAHSRPAVSAYYSPRQAIALDCEMGCALNMDTELIRLTAVDFFTGARLVDSLVYPSVKMKHYNTRYSGVSARDMHQAARSRHCIFGRDEARRQLLNFVDPETIVVVHGGNSDFSALRWIHEKVIDTFLLDSYFFGRREGGRSLKNLCQQILGVTVQAGKKGHDSLEDALACRELAHTWVSAIPD